MNAVPNSHNDKTKARALALAMHAVFIVLLVFGVSWQKKPPAPVVADLWSSLPPLPMPQPRVQVAPEPELEPEPPPKPAPRITPPPVPKAEPAPVPKPEIALKKPPEKEKPKVEPKPEPRVEPKKREDDSVARARKEAQEKQRREEIEADQKRLAAEREAKAAEDKAAAVRAEADRVARAAAAREAEKYIAGIKAKVYARVAVPSDLQGNPEAEFVVALFPGGELDTVTMTKSSGNAAYDAAIERAIKQAQPFAVPTGDLFQRNFRRFPMAFRPR